MSFIKTSGSEPTPFHSKERDALAELHSSLENGQKWVKVHAAEYLVWTGHAVPVLKEFLKEEKLYPEEPKYRIGIWRVLTQAEKSLEKRKIWLDKIYAAFTDLNGPDRTHATETLAKLRQPVADLFPLAMSKTLQSEDRILHTYALWACSYNSDGKTNLDRGKFLTMLLTDPDTTIRKVSAFVLRKAKGLTTQQWERLADLAIKQMPENDLYVTLLSTALVTAPADADQNTLFKINEHLINVVSHYNVVQLSELCLALAEAGSISHLPILKDILNDRNSQGLYIPASDEGRDLRASAAYAIISINSKIHNQ